MAMELWRCLPEQWSPETEILMEAHIWQDLPQDMLLKILASLPIRVLAKMRTVSRQWRELLSLPDAPQRIDPEFSVHSIPGFFVQLEWASKCTVQTWVIEYLGGDSSDMNIYRAPLPADVVIVDACRNIYCSHRRGHRMELSIGNLATGSGRRLPYHRILHRWSFIAMNFDPTRRRCTVLVGENHQGWPQPDDNRMLMEIYDSESNAWTTVAMTVSLSISPRGKGIYSKGKFYWIISWLGISRVVAFTIAERCWTEIEFPLLCLCVPKQFELSGCEGRVMLVVYSPACPCIHMWKLKEGPGAPEWCDSNPIWLPQRPNFRTVGVNSSEWTMMFDGEWKMSICHPKRRLIRCITLPSVSRWSPPSRVFVSAFESNNVSWP